MRTLTRLLVTIGTIAVLAGCGAPPDEAEPAGAASLAPASSTNDSSTTSTSDDTVAPVTESTASISTVAPAGPDTCAGPPVTPPALAEAQFAFIGTVIDRDELVHPWTTDPENPDRPEIPTTMSWVMFGVEQWYRRDWGLIFSVWMPTTDVSVGQRVAVGGDAYHTYADGFSGQSGEVEFCIVLGAAESPPAGWEEFLGAPIVPSPETLPTSPPLPATKAFGEYRDVCAPTVLDNDVVDDDAQLAPGASCFLGEYEAGRPTVWDVLYPTVEGDPIVTRYDFDGTIVKITTDHTFDNFGSNGVIEQRCASVTASDWLPVGIDCTEGLGEGFLADTLPERTERYLQHTA